MKLIKWLVILAIVAGAIGGGWWWWKRRANDAPQYQTTAVVRGDLTQLVTATGQLNPVLNVQVGSQISGIIDKLFVDFNSPVKAGQVIALIDPSTYQANLLQAEADLASVNAALELAKINESRAKELLAKELIPPSDYDKSIAGLHQAEATVKQKEASRAKVKIDLDRCTITAPVDGIVISRNVDVGQTVAASLSAPTLFVIANDLTKMQIDANVAEADIGVVEVGQKVDFTVDAFPMRTFHGEVMQVRNAPLTVQNVVTYDTVIAVNNGDLKLKPGMTANVSIIIAQRPEALKIPNAALRYRPADTTKPAPGAAKKREHSPTRTVYILDTAGKPQPVQVKTGITDGLATEITDGLKEDDKVITSSTAKPTTSAPQNPFSPGMPRRF
ncbi:MAG: efflux RND transporter periplasmic adaptor subunit [Verrucomicrobiota bacterium]